MACYENLIVFNGEEVFVELNYDMELFISILRRVIYHLINISSPRTILNLISQFITYVMSLLFEKIVVIRLFW